MLKVFWLFLSFVISVNANAFEPVLDQQGMLYFNVTFDAGQSTKTEHDFGFRFDRTLTQPGDVVTFNQLNNKPAVLNLKLNNNGLKSFELNGIDYSREYYVARAEGEEDVQATPQKKIDIPLGVVIGVGIGALALAGFN